MTTADSGNMIVGLDIGTSKVVAIVGEVTTTGDVKVIGIGSHPSRGLKRGVVVNIDSTVHAIKRAIEEAELMAGCQIHSVYVGIAGDHVKSHNSQGIVAIKDREVTKADVERVIDTAQATAITAGRKILHILPQEYMIDAQDGVKEPVGMFGVRLEAKVHLVTCAVNAAQNIENCVRRCGLEVDDLVLEQLASSYAVLSEDEKELGVCLVDIGGGTTDIAIFTRGAIRHIDAIPAAGDHVTNDIAMALPTPTKNAEDLKIKYACAQIDIAGEDEMIRVPGVGDRASRELPRRELAQVVEPRYKELFMLVKHKIRCSGFEGLIPAGIVLTGGTSKMEGAVGLAEKVFGMPVRLGMPQVSQGINDAVHNPIYSTAVGLLDYAVQTEKSVQHRLSTAAGGSIIHRFRQWFQGNF
ncbi:Cell division protein FtsA [invertebrate metagenome]|uniref:Cell division protein FtsA n=1 Tax=invertebrate metagenome TaxID=1711999 RepID=A0A2H9TAU2_9ZZZZ